MNRISLTVILAVVVNAGCWASGRKLTVMIVNGHAGFHGVREATQAFRDTLIQTGRFDVHVSSAPAQDASTDAWSKWRPEFRRFDTVVLNSFGDQWPDDLVREFVNYVREGGGLVLYHMTVGSFDGRGVYEDIFDHMTGLGWNLPEKGVHVIFDENRSDFVRLPPYIGPGAGHGRRHEFVVTSRSPEHPVMRGMPTEWLHGKDELYHGMRGPAENLTILATAFSAKELWGSGDHEPVAWTVRYGRGRVLATVLGHRWPDSPIVTDELRELTRLEKDVGMNPAENGSDAIHCVGFQTLFVRGVEWAGSGSVTIPVPRSFPSRHSSSVVNPTKVVWSSN